MEEEIENKSTFFKEFRRGLFLCFEVFCANLLMYYFEKQSNIEFQLEILSPRVFFFEKNVNQNTLRLNGYCNSNIICIWPC